jgi:hypothetical protein
MAVTTAAVVGATAAAGSLGFGIAAQRQQRRAQEGLLNQAQRNAASIYGTTPEFEPVEYNPLFESDPGYANLVGQIIGGNRRNLRSASRLSGDVNQEISAASRRRIEGWDPGYMGNLAALQQTRDTTSQGYLPYEDAMNIIGSRGRMGADLGIAGGTGAQTARDLGMTRLSLMTETGPQLAAQITDIINANDPIQRHSTPNEYLLPTQFGVASAINENQFGATFGFQQNQAIAGFNALPNPQAQGLFNLQAFQAGFAGQGSQAMANNLGQVASLAGMFGAFSGGGTAAPRGTYQNQYGDSVMRARSVYTNQPIAYPNTGSTQYFG